MEEQFRFKKQLGQNFLSDKNLLKAIVNDAEINKTDEVLEIGVGFGALTYFLCENAKKVVCYEIDTTLKEKIEENLKEFNNYNLVFKDILKATDKEINKNFTKKFKVVANLPYYITTPIIFKFLEGNFDIESLTIMVQKEVGERICSGNNLKSYGILSVMVQSMCETKIMREVNRKLFNPAPNVDSVVIKLKMNKNKYQISNYLKFKNFVQLSFNMRRKTLINNLKKEYNLENILNSFKKLSLSENLRAENLSVQNFVYLFNLLNNQADCN